MMPGSAGVDALVERTGRWAAARTTRRSFLGRLGRGAMLVASGPAVATLLADQAEARVCGQSGVSPKCPTFDCEYAASVWGWCWYANGCCAGGLLKKICDCCTTNWPNVHGYCPSGTNVRCIVESCGTDPRLMTVDLRRLVSDDPFAVAVATHAARFPSGARIAVLADAEAPFVPAVAAPLAAVVGGPLLPVGRGPAPGAVVSALQALGVARVLVVGGDLPPTLDSSLAGSGFTVERVGVAPEAAPLSVEVAAYIRQINGSTTSVAIEPFGVSGAAASVAAAYGGSIGAPLLVGAQAAREAGVPALFVGPEAAGGAATLPGSQATTSTALVPLSAELADAALARRPAAAPTVVLAVATTAAQAGVTDLATPLVLFAPGQIVGPAEDHLFRRIGTYGRPRRAFVAGATGGLGTASIWRLQSTLNGFEVHRLIGVAGQGLPVIPQPFSERCIGCARVGSAASARIEDRGGTYWTDRATE